MKKITLYIIICLLSCGISSCYSSKQKVTFYGEPGTEIYNPKLEKLGTIENDGKTEIKLSRYEYIPFLLSYDKTSNKYYPFGIDFKYTNEHLVRLLIFTPLTVGWWAIFNNGYIDSDQLTYGYKYLNEQKILNYYPNADYPNTGPRREIAKFDNEEVSNSATESLLQKKTSTRSKLIQKNLSEQLQGEYIGTGKLLKGSKVIESHDNVSILMAPIDKNTVSVKILINGDEAIIAECEYTIKRLSNNRFTLISKSNKSAKITISENTLTYNNSKVEIDGVIYKLVISVSK